MFILFSFVNCLPFSFTLPAKSNEREIKLCSFAFFTPTDLDIPFETEAELRVRGTARTPDVLLSIPLGIRVRRKMRDDSSRRNLFRATNDERVGVRDDEMATPQRLVFEEKGVNTSPARKRGSTIDEYLKNDDDYEWKSICWIDSKVRVKADSPFT